MTTASWTMQEDIATHWWSTVTCQHGQTQNGIWTQKPVVDDRNFVNLMSPTFANHQSGTGCTCDTLAQDWQPSYTPPSSPPLPRARRQNTPIVQDSSGTAIFTYQLMMAPSWYAGFVDCLHGQTLEGIWQVGPPPPMPALLEIAQAMLQNHQRLLADACQCTFAAPGPPTATADVVPQSVPADTSAVLAQASTGTWPSGFVVDGFGRMSTTQAGLVTISASFFLAQSVDGGASGIAALRLPDAGTGNLTAPSVVTAGLMDSSGVATATLNWNAEVPANTSFEINFWNGSGLFLDVQGGSLVVTLQ